MAHTTGAHAHARAAAALIVALTATPAVAAEAAGDAAARAKSWFDRGSELQGRGEFAPAAAAYLEAFALVPHPVYLYNAAVATRLAGRGTEALHLYERFLALDPTTPLRGEVETRIAGLRARLPKPAPASAVPGAPGSAAPATPAGVAAPAPPAASVAPGVALPAAPPAAPAARRGVSALAVGLAVAGGIVLGGTAAALLTTWVNRPTPFDRTCAAFPGTVIDQASACN